MIGLEQKLKIKIRSLILQVLNYRREIKSNKSLRKKLLNLSVTHTLNKNKKRSLYLYSIDLVNLNLVITWMRAIELAEIINQGSNINCEAITKIALKK